MPPSPAVSSPSSPVFPHHSLSLSSLLSRSLSPSLGLNLPAPPSPAARVVLRSMEPPKQSAAARTPETVAVQSSGRGENGRRGQPAGKPPAAMTERRRRRGFWDSSCSRRRAPSPSKFDSGPPRQTRLQSLSRPVEASVSTEGMVLQGMVGEVWADFSMKLGKK